MANFAKQTINYRFWTGGGINAKEYTAQVDTDGLVKFRAIDNVCSAVEVATVRDSTGLTPEELKEWEETGVGFNAKAIAILRGRQALEKHGYKLEDTPVSEKWGLRHPKSMWQKVAIPNLVNGEVINVGDFRELIKISEVLGLGGTYICADPCTNFEFVTYRHFENILTEYSDDDNVAVYLFNNDASSDRVRLYKTDKDVTCIYATYTEQCVASMQNETITFTDIKAKVDKTDE